MRLLLKILAAPLIAALALLVWICSGLLYCTAFIFGLAGTIVAVLGVAVLVTYSVQNGIILLVIAFLVSPMGLPVAAGKAPGPALYHSGLDLRISQTKTAPTLKKRRGCSSMRQERRGAFGNYPHHAPAHRQGPERGHRYPRYSGLC